MARRKRGYQEPAPVGEILPGIMRGLRPKKADPLAAVRQAWPRLVGEPVARRSRLVSLKDGELTIEVASAALRHDLSVFRKDQLLQGLRECGVERLRCRVSGGL
ncbi:MAG: DciA family protein [Planctomycetota bacterium]|jgi:hypothetical protein